jgi:hypothetical protein
MTLGPWTHVKSTLTRELVWPTLIISTLLGLFRVVSLMIGFELPLNHPATQICLQVAVCQLNIMQSNALRSVTFHFISRNSCSPWKEGFKNATFKSTTSIYSKIIKYFR